MRTADVICLLLGIALLVIVFKATQDELESCRKRNGELVRGAWGFACVAAAKGNP